MKVNPATGATWKHTEILAWCGSQWAAMSDAEKAPFVKLEAAELARHAKQTEEYKKHGYYTKPDGTKSNAGLESKKAAESEEDEEEAKPVVKKQSKKNIAKNKKKEETSELSLKEESASKADGKLLFSDEDS